MFFPEKIKSIKITDKVLEIGPGSLPHPRADVFLDKKFSSEEQFIQNGNCKNKVDKKKIVLYDGERFPFNDNEFDYIICSHVIEHVDIKELSTFISEISRVANKGYIECPSVFYELICFPKAHKWFVNFRDDSLFFLDKSSFRSNNIHKIYREMFYGSDKYLYRIFKRYKELFFIGFEWRDKIDFKITGGYDQLVNEADLDKFHRYFKNFNPGFKNNMMEKIFSINSKIEKIIKKIW